MAVTMAEITKLRTMTGAGMMDCKNALIEAENDFEKDRVVVLVNHPMVLGSLLLVFWAMTGKKYPASRSNAPASLFTLFFIQ